MAKRNQYWLLLLALVLTASFLLTPGSTYAHYYNTTVWNTLLTPENGEVSSNCLVPDGKQTILLGVLPESGKPYDFTLEGTPGTAAPITWFVNEEAVPYLDAELRIGDTQLSGGQVITIPDSGKVTLTLFLNPVTTRVYDDLPASITVNWGEDKENNTVLLGGTFQTTLPAVEAKAVKVTASNIDFTPEGAAITLADLPREGLSLDITLSSDKELAQALTWSVDDAAAPYLDVTMTVDGKVLRSGDEVTVPYDSLKKEMEPVTVTMTLTPTANAAHAVLPATVNVAWGDLKGIFQTNLPEVAAASDTLTAAGATVQLDPLPQEGQTQTFTLSALADTTAPLTWTVDSSYLNVTMSIGDTPLTSGEALTVIAGTPTTVTMTLIPTAPVEADTTANIQVAWGDLLQGTFQTTLEAPETQEDQEETNPGTIEETQPEETEPTEPPATEPPATEASALDSGEAAPNAPMTTTETEVPTEPTASEAPTEPTVSQETTPEQEEDPANEEEPSNNEEEPSDDEETTTEPTQPTPEPDTVTVQMTTLGHFAPQGMIPVELLVSSNTEHILISLAASTEAGSPIGLLPAFTRYTLDGSHYYLLYNGGSIVLDKDDLPQTEHPEGTEPPAQTTVLLFLDISATELSTKADLILVAQAVREGQETTDQAESRSTLHLALGDDLTQAMVLTDQEPLELTLPESWKGLTLKHAVDVVMAEETDDSDPLLAYYPVVEDREVLQVTRVAMENEPHVLTLRVGTKPPPAGTYQLTLNWYYQGICFSQTQITFFVNYPVNTEPEETGGAVQ